MAAYPVFVREEQVPKISSIFKGKRKVQPLINIEIAGVNFSIESLHKMKLEELPTSYGNFLNKVNAAYDSIKVRLELNNIPVPIMTKIFDTDESWSMFVNDDEYFVTLNSPVLDKRIVWFARFKKDFSETVVYCSEMLIRITEMDGITKVINPLCYPLDQILLMYYLSHREGALIHCAGLEYDGRGYIFPGKSGAGKSTISRILAGRDGFDILSDDRMVVRKFGSTFYAFGTPWPGEAEIAVNKNFPLSAIFFVSHGMSNRIERMAPREALERLLPLTSIPWYDVDIMTKMLAFCEDLTSHMPAYALSFKPDAEVTDLFENFISK